jgi:hypothetical protein
MNAYVYPTNPVEGVDPLGLSEEAVAAAIPIALTAAAADGPLPIGDIVGGVILAGAAIYSLTCSGNKTKTTEEERTKTKCKDATPQNIIESVKDSTLLTQQEEVSVPVVAAYTMMIEQGSVPPPVKMDGQIIVDGNHRMVAAILCGTNPPIQASTASPSVPVYPFSAIQPTLTDWGNR